MGVSNIENVFAFPTLDMILITRVGGIAIA